MAIKTKNGDNLDTAYQKPFFDKHTSSSFTDWWQISGFADIDNLIFFRNSEIVSMVDAQAKDSESTFFPDEEPTNSFGTDSDNKSTASCLSLGPVELNHVVRAPRPSLITESQDDNFLSRVSVFRSSENPKICVSLTGPCRVVPADRYKARETNSLLIFESYDPVPLVLFPTEAMPKAQDTDIQQNVGGSWKNTMQSLRNFFCSCL